VELSAFYCFLMHVLQINVRSLESIQASFEVLICGCVEGKVFRYVTFCL